MPRFQALEKPFGKKIIKGIGLNVTFIDGDKKWTEGQQQEFVNLINNFMKNQK